MRRKFLSLSLIFVMLLAVMPSPLHAEDTDFIIKETDGVSCLDDNYEYVINVPLQGTDKIVVVLGQGKDTDGHEYNFDFINDPSRLSLDHTEVKEIADNTYAFISGDELKAVLTYYPDGHGKNPRCFELVSEQPFSDVQLSYSVRLENPNDFAGTYTGLMASQIQYENETKDVVVEYEVPYSYTVEHHYYTFSLDTPEPMEDGVIVEKDPVVTHTAEINVDSLMVTSPDEDDFESEKEPEIDEPEVEVPDQGEDEDKPEIDEPDQGEDEDEPDQGEDEKGTEKPTRPPWWEWPWWPWKVTKVHALEHEKDEQKFNFGKGYAYRVIDGELIPILDGKVTLDRDPSKNKIVIKYYRTSYTVEHKYYTSTNNAQYRLDGTVLSKEYMGFEGETIYTHNILTKVRYRDEIYSFYKYNSDSIVLQLNPHLNKVIIEYRRNINEPRDGDVMDDNTPSQTKPIPGHRDKVPNTGDHSNIALYAGLTIAMLIAIVFLLKKKK